ncbi:hypothetical protein AGOR_G00108840 [Albula goreensis]|uniref:GCF C-terminal domain-containing protein n=1 Tax=Albula goreensis TaxID=1534307 RepID=A0A8T3DI14_9TELE|nr:hypothetical protein AGOR_G00108840 [Albula goreensis]
MQQFEKEAQERINEMGSQLEQILATVDRVFQVELMKMPPQLQNTLMSDLMREDDSPAGEVTVAIHAQSPEIHQPLTRKSSKKVQIKANDTQRKRMLSVENKPTSSVSKKPAKSRSLAELSSATKRNKSCSTSSAIRTQGRVAKVGDAAGPRGSQRSTNATGISACPSVAATATILTSCGETLFLSDDVKDVIDMDLLDDAAVHQMQKLMQLMDYLCNKAKSKAVEKHAAVNVDSTTTAAAATLQANVSLTDLNWIMFNKKPKRNFRKRRDESSDEDEQKSNEEGEEKNVVPVSAIRQSKLPQSRGISCSSKPEVATSKSDSSGAEDADDKGKDTTDEKLLQRDEKKENLNNMLSFSSEKEVDSCDFKVKKSTDKEVVFKVRRKASPAPVTVKDKKSVVHPASPASSENLESGDDGAGEEVLSGSDGDSHSSKSSSSGHSAPKIGVIPDSRQIHAARRQRREARAQKDYIPLHKERESTPLTGEEESEAESDETDDHERRIHFAPKPKTLRERIAEEMGGSESEGDDSDSLEDEDHTTWEEQQIGKGVKRHKQSDSDSSQEKVSHQQHKEESQHKAGVLEAGARAREAEQRRIQLDIDDARAALDQLENGSAQEQHKFYKSMRVYSQNLLECLSEKVVEINAMELDVHTLLIDQAEALLARRREAVREESTRLQQLAYDTNPASNGHVKSQTEIQGESQVSVSKGENGGSVPADNEPLPEEEAEFCRKRDEILRKAEGTFADVQEDFSNVKNILSKFDEWRVLFPDSYQNAYISLCLPKLLAPLIRHQLIGWNPLNAESRDFEDFPWYSAVEKFCHGQGYEESERKDDKTLTSIIEKTIVTKIQGFVEFVWDPLSSRQSQCLVNLCQRLQDDYSIFGPEQSKPVKAFVEAITVRMKGAVDEDVFIPLYPKKFLDDAHSQQYVFRDRQFCSAVKLMGNITLWDGLIPEDVLKELALDKLLNRYLMMTLLNTTSEKDSVEKCKKVAVCFPKSWFKNVDTVSSIPQLQNFSKHLFQTAHSLCKKSPDITNTRDIVANLLILMRNIKALENMTEIVEKYHLEGFEELGSS